MKWIRSGFSQIEYNPTIIHAPVQTTPAGHQIQKTIDISLPHEVIQR
ncbi:hypothetical protein [Escherichia coli IS9]|nr:hypothetical protein [Escherichia coli IS9]CDK85123.1 hypothetical protein [Escherichia coli IS25]